MAELGTTGAGGATAGGYDPQRIEAKWQRRWGEARVFESEADPSQRKYYVLEMLPYPSGTMHMGHMRNYAIGDVVARVKRMRGFNVLHPMGWDAFGLPAENAAIKNKTHPRIWTNNNIAQFQKVLRRSIADAAKSLQRLLFRFCPFQCARGDLPARLATPWSHWRGRPARSLVRRYFPIARWLRRARSRS